MAVCSLLPTGGKVMELGGGDGLQARVLADAGFDVTSIDIGSRNTRGELLFPVSDYDGRTIPFGDGTFDAVFSSNVLEHIPDLANSLAEIRRVLKVGGVAVHILPTPIWRFWTTLTHYPWLVRRTLLRHKETPLSVTSTTDHAAPGAAGPRSRWKVWLSALALGFAPHGEYPNAIAELYYFRKHTWERTFAASGFEVASYSPTGLFYSGHLLFAPLPISTRRALARFLGSSCAIFVTRASSAL
jgi:SAM-dependent methyltransferase